MRFSPFSCSHISTAQWSRMLLLSMGLLDELIAGIPVIALPLMHDRLHLGYVQIGVLFTVATLSGLLFEPVINFFSDNRAKKLWILCGLLLLTLTFMILASTTHYPLLLLAFTLSAPAGAASVGLSQAALIDAQPQSGTRTITRWTFLSNIGDFLAPLVVSLFLMLHLGWPHLCLLAATLCFIMTITLLPLPFPAPCTQPAAIVVAQSQEAVAGAWTTLLTALRDPLLVRWSILAVLPTMLDEIFLSYVVLYLHDVLYVGQAMIALIVMLQMLASLAGLLWLERHITYGWHSPIRLLALLCTLTLGGVLTLLFSHTLWLVIVALIVISASCAGWYPLAKGQAYTSKPNHAAMVNAVISLGAPFEMLLPAAIGLISATVGIIGGLAVLGTAPILMLIILPYQHSHKT